MIEAVVKRQWPDKSTIISVIILFVGTMMAGDVGCRRDSIELKGTLLG